MERSETKRRKSEIGGATGRHRSKRKGSKK